MAQVTIRGPVLQVYSEPSAESHLQIGELSNGEFITVSTTKTVKSYVWARFSSRSFTNAWVIVKSPNVNYQYIDLDAESPYGMATAISSSVITGGGNSTTEGQLLASTDYGYIPSNNLDDGKTEDAPGKITTGDGENSGKIFIPRLRLGNLDDGARRTHAIQNNRGYPFAKGTEGGREVFDYATDYSAPALQDALYLVRDSINFSLSEPTTLFRWSAENYNRYKVVFPNELLTKAFPHVFFIRPSCELLDVESGTSPTLGYNVKDVPLYNLYFRNCPEVIYSLVKNYGSNHSFMMMLSNKAEGFELRDRSLDVDTYGKSFRGNSVAYGRHSEKSTAAGDFSVQFTDDYDLHVLKIHELWMDYISGIKTGRYTPTESNVINKVLDYAGAVFYFLCGADGETIIYSAKYTGVFPSTIPDSILNYQKGTVINNPSYSITYQYSWAELDTPEVMQDFNQMSAPINYVAEAPYQPDILSTGTTWVGAPYIEAVKQNDGSIQYKLRFRHLSKRGR